MEPRRRVFRFQPDRHLRTARWNRFAAGVSIGEDDALGWDHLEDFAQGLHTAGLKDQDLSAWVRVDGGTHAPPSGPARAVGEEGEHGFRSGLNENAAVEPVYQRIHYVLSFLAGLRRRGFGPRRVSPSSASSFKRQSASSHIRSSIGPTAPNP